MTAERRILRLLADGAWHVETELRSSFWFLQRLYLRGLIDGAMLTYGGTPADRLWRLSAMHCPKFGAMCKESRRG